MGGGVHRTLPMCIPWPLLHVGREPWTLSALSLHTHNHNRCSLSLRVSSSDTTPPAAPSTAPPPPGETGAGAAAPTPTASTAAGAMVGPSIDGRRKAGGAWASTWRRCCCTYRHSRPPTSSGSSSGTSWTVRVVEQVVLFSPIFPYFPPPPLSCSPSSYTHTHFTEHLLTANYELSNWLCVLVALPLEFALNMASTEV